MAGDGVGAATPGRCAPELHRLQTLAKQHKLGDVPRLDWLDPLSLRTLHELAQREMDGSRALFLSVKWPAFDAAVVFFEPGCDAPPPTGMRLPGGPRTPCPPPLAPLAEQFVLDPEALLADNLVRAGLRARRGAAGFFLGGLVAACG